jgi:hypothetical protein
MPPPNGRSCFNSNFQLIEKVSAPVVIKPADRSRRIADRKVTPTIADARPHPSRLARQTEAASWIAEQQCCGRSNNTDDPA